MAIAVAAGVLAALVLWVLWVVVAARRRRRRVAWRPVDVGSALARAREKQRRRR